MRTNITGISHDRYPPTADRRQLENEWPEGFTGGVRSHAQGAHAVADKTDLLVCPPATLISAFAEKARGAKTLSVGAQDCHPKPSGAHTGDLSAEMLADAGLRP